MRIRFRTKILLSLLLTVAALLGGALIALDRAYVRKVEGMVGERYAQGRRNFDLSTGRVREALEWGCDAISESSRFKSVLEAGDSPDHVEQAALFEMEYRGVWAQFLVVADVDGKSIVRCRAPRGASREEAKRPTERHAAAAGGTPPEAALVQRALAVAEELQAGAEGLEKATAELREFLLDDGRIYLVVARPVDDEGHLRGVVVLGAEMSEEVANRLHETLVGEDAAAFVAEQHFKGASFPPALRVEAEAAVQDRLAGVGPGEEADLECVIGGKAYRAVLSPIQRRGAAVPIYAALFVCLETFVEFRREMRELTVGTGAVAVVLCIFLSVAVARGVSAPVLDLVAGTGRVANGEYSARIRIHSRDELGDLAESFNRMAEDLASKEKVRAVLNKVVSRDVAETLLKTEDLGLGGRLVDATLLFADLRGFTALTQGMAPEQVVSMLNEFMTAMSREILDAKGIVDKYVGDEIIGVFGAPKSYGQDAAAAVRAACRMRERLAELNEKRRGRGDPPLAMGIGINTGAVVAGCMGSEELMSYTCIGAAVNLTSRLCSNAKPGQILISEPARRAAAAAAGGGLEVHELEPIRVKGFDHPVPVFEVLSSPALPATPKPAPSGAGAGASGGARSL